MTQGSAPSWRALVRAMAAELELLCEPDQRDELLRRVGMRMAQSVPLAEAVSLEGLEAEMNFALAMLGWGECRILFDDAGRCLRVLHLGLPSLGAMGNWLEATLEGIYGVWFAAQPEADPELKVTRLAASQPGVIELRYGKGG